VRRIFFALLFLNLAYFAWANFLAAPTRPQANGTTAHLPTVKLVEEAAQGQAPEATTKKTVAADPDACVSVGPFGDVDNSAKAAAVLKAKGFEPKQRAEAGETSAGYVVYVAGMATQAETDQLLVNIEKAGIRDAILMPATGDAPRRISLGLFSERARADRRVQQARSLGFRADVTERKLPTAIYWVDVVPPQGAGTIPLQDLFAEGMSSRIAVQPCPQAVKNAVAAANPPAVSPAPGPPAQPAQVASAPKP
jgi:hypothetical protein